VAAVSNMSVISINGNKAKGSGKKCTGEGDFRFDYSGHNSSGTIFVGSQVKRENK
jgi:hypothetical protein